MKPQNKFFTYIDIDSVDNKRHVVSNPKLMLSSEAPSRASRGLQNGSVIFSMVRPYLENIAYIDTALEGCIASTGFYVCNSNGVFYPRYMFYLMLSGYVINGLNQFMKGDNSPSINRGNIEKWIYPIPPVNEQKKIVEKIEQTFELISTADLAQTDLVETINKVKSRILDLAIRGKLVPQDPNDEPGSVLLERIRAEKEELVKQGKIKRDKKESVIFKGEDNSYYEKVGKSITCIDDEIPFEVPDGWQFVRLKELWELLSGRDLLPNEYNDKSIGIPYITGASNFANGTITIARWTEHPQVIAEKGDLLITCKGTVGEIAYNSLEQAHIARQIMAIRNLYCLNTEYLKLCLEYNLERIKSAAKGLIPGISRDDFLNILLPIPSEHHQVCIVEQVQKINMIVDSIEASLS